MNETRHTLVGAGMGHRGRRSVLVVLAAAAAAQTAWAQSGPALRRVAITGTAPDNRYRAAFKRAMHDRGWVESSTVEYRVLETGDADTLAGTLAAFGAEVIVVGSAAPLRVVRQATGTIPIVMANVANAVDSGFVASLANPGGNITGITTQHEDLVAKQVQLLHEAAPAARRFAVLLNEANPSQALFWRRARAACDLLGLQALRVVASSAATFPAAAARIAREHVQAVVVPADPLFNLERMRLNDALAAIGVPVAYGLRENVEAGGLLSYGTDILANHRAAARYVDKILRGAKPRDLPVEQPTKFELVVNQRTARALGLTLPRTLLLRADEVIE